MRYKKKFLKKNSCDVVLGIWLVFIKYLKDLKMEPTGSPIFTVI